MAQKKSKKRINEKYDHYFTSVVNIFVYVILCIFPLFYRNYYFDILEAKYAFYWIAVVSLALILLVMALYYKWDDINAYFKGFTIKKWIKSLIMPDWAMLSFLIVAVISTLLSDYKYEAFWGNNGRYSGLFLISLYCLSYFIITRLSKFRERFLDMFLISGTLVGLFGITDFFQMDILNFKVNMKPEQIPSYTSTIGNINTYTAFIALVMAISFVLFATSKDTKKMLVYYACYIISTIAIIMGLSDNAYLSIAALFGLSPLYLFANRRGVKRYAFGILGFLAVVKGIAYICSNYADKVLRIDGVFNQIAEFKYLGLTVALIVCVICIMYLVDYLLRNKKSDTIKPWLRWLCLVIVILGLGMLFYVLYDVNMVHNVEKYGALKKYLEFNDSWGTSRGYIWRMSMELYGEFPLIKKLIGFGPDTYGMLTVLERYNEMMERYNLIFDSAHNEYLHYLLTMGVLGVLSYASIFVTSVVTFFRKAYYNPYVMAVCYAVICYSIQAVVNINLPIATPILYTLLMIGVAECRKKTVELV